MPWDTCPSDPDHGAARAAPAAARQPDNKPIIARCHETFLGPLFSMDRWLLIEKKPLGRA